MALQARAVGRNVEQVECPHCGKRRPAPPGVYVCGDCGQPFTIQEVEG